MITLKRKYDHAKRIIHELSRHEQLLAVQLRERDQEYNSHLRLLKQRVHQLEDELATTQKFAGIPVRLPYGQDQTSPLRDGQLSPPELLKQPPVSFVILLLMESQKRAFTCEQFYVDLEKLPFVCVTQCVNVIIPLLLRFYVKLNLAISGAPKLQFGPFGGLEF